MKFPARAQKSREKRTVLQPYMQPVQPVDRYLIDTENFGREWVNIITGRENAVYHIFYTDKSPAIPIEYIEQLVAQKAQLRFIKCYIGANALDFQLVTQLGYMLAASPRDRYHIVSSDRGFDAVVKFWKERELSVDRIGKPGTKPALNICEETDVENLYHDVLSGLVTEEELTRVLGIIRSISAKGKPDYKYEIHQALVREFTQSRGSRIYNSCKSIIEYEHAE